MKSNAIYAPAEKQLRGFSFLFPDGTVSTVYAENEYAAAKLAREQYYGG